ncbi:MAG: hypothetical protein ABIR06_23540 [Cyclobacteriaceae bacterium]
MKTLYKNISVVIAILLVTTGTTLSQIPDSTTVESIAVAARPTGDSIILRWAPINFTVWQLGNSQGYKIERFVIARNGLLLKETEKTILNTSVKPLPENQWEHLVKDTKYAAISAQALFGDRFEIDLRQSDIFTIVNKVRENDQRFAFALFSADMSPKVARASGLWYTDKLVRKGEKYLYRVTINTPDSLRGSIFISPDDEYQLTKPQNIKAEFKDQIVSLRWDKSNQYTAYIVERSEDGKHFVSISDTPLVTVSPNESEETQYGYAIDSLKDLSNIYHYRVKGVTTFGEESYLSDVVNGKGTLAVSQVPYIRSVQSIDNKSLHLSWDFPEENNAAIKSFIIERSSEAKGSFTPLTPQGLSPQTRIYEDKNPPPVNYYRVSALGLDGDLYQSHIYYAQLIDSLPPASPVALQASINEAGTVTLSWKRNEESDIYGYRIYKATHRSEEPAQITVEPIPESSFIDHVNLQTLNETVYYRVMSIDRSQNHSPLSDALKVSLPDKVKPQAPVLLPVKSISGGVSLSWVPSSSDDVLNYAVYRKGPDKKEWELLGIKKANDDSVFYYIDKKLNANEINQYTIVAIDDSGLESEPTHAVNGSRIDNASKPSIKWEKHILNIEQNEVTLRWVNNQSGVETYKIYKEVDKGQIFLFLTVTGEKKQITDSLVPGQLCKYRIMAVFEDGSKSLVSEEAILQN